MDEFEILKELTEVFGPSTCEDEVIDCIKKILADRFHYIVTPHKNLIVFNTPSRWEKTVILQAHMDELGFRPYKYLPDGFIELSPMGGIPAFVSNQLLLFKPSMVVGILLIAGSGREAKYYLDIGAKDGREALEMIPYHSNGAYAGIKLESSKTQLLGKSFDDRAGCAVIARVLKTVSASSRNRIVGLFSSREETGDWPIPEIFRSLNEFNLMPDMILNIELCPGGPSPLEPEPIAILGKGAVLVHMDSSYAADSRLCQRITSLAEKKSIPHQHIAMRKGAGEMGRLALGFGTLSYSITIPGRYSHCPHSVIARDDYLAAIRLASAIADEFPFE